MFAGIYIGKIPGVVSTVVLFHYRNNGVPNKLFNVIAPQSAVDFMPYRERKRRQLRTFRRGNHSHILTSNDTSWNI